MNKADKVILSDAVARWGSDAQIEMLQEECLELALAARKVLRNPNVSSRLDDLFDEMADVSIMLDQMNIIFGCGGVVKERRDQKLERLRRRVYYDDFEAE